MSAPAAAPAPPLVPSPGEHDLPFPLTEIQQAYWLGRSPAFELGGVAIQGYAEVDADGLDLPALEAAWNAVVARHGMLRAVVIPGGAQRVLAEVPPYRIATDDLRGRDAAEAGAALAETRARMSRQRFDAERWPLWEIRASRVDERRYRLHVCLDGLCVDLSSVTLVLREWMALYDHPAAPLAAVDLTFRDYVLGVERLRDSPAYARALEWWRARIPELPPAPQLPLAETGDAPPRFIRRALSLDADAWGAVKARAAAAGLTPSSALLAAYAEVVGAWSAHGRFSLNVTVANRLPLHAGVNALVGDFTSMVLVAAGGGGGSFVDRALRLQRELWGALEHHPVSGVTVLRELARLQGGGPYARMPVVYTGALGSPGFHLLERLGPLVHCVTQTPQVLLDQQVCEHQGVLRLSWDAADDRFAPGVLDDMFAATRQLLGSLAESEAAWRRAEPPSLAPAAQLERRAAVNATDEPVAAVTPHALFAARARERGDAVAVAAADRAVGYAELHRRAVSLSRRLRACGVGDEELVAIVMEKEWEQAVGALAVLFAGAACLPVDPAVPPARLAWMLEHGGVRIALTQSWLDGRLAWPGGTERIAVDGERGEDGDPGGDFGGAAEGLAYVLYTSGSTGTPRGAMIEHRSVVNRVLDVNRRFGVGAGDRVFSITPLHHDLSAYDLFGLLAAGGAVVLPSPGGTRDPAHWARRMASEGVTVWNSVPAAMEMLCAHLESAGGAPGGVRDALRLVLLSGDWIPLTLPGRVRALFPAARVVSLGGPTETTIWDICHPVDAVDPAWARIPYGRPMANARYHVLDAALEPRPDWVPGPLYAAGAGLARGYWRDEAATRERFIVHPRTGERLFRTGDVGRFLPDGTIELLGREDQQVKIRGRRVEPGEIEAALLRHPRVRAAAVEAPGDPGAARTLVAWVVPRSDAAHRVDDGDAAPSPPGRTNGTRPSNGADPSHHPHPSSASQPAIEVRRFDRIDLSVAGDSSNGAHSSNGSHPPNGVHRSNGAHRENGGDPSAAAHRSNGAHLPDGDGSNGKHAANERHSSTESRLGLVESSDRDRVAGDEGSAIPGDAEVAAFKLSRPGLRRWSVEPPSIDLPRPPVDADAYAARASHRRFLPTPLRCEALGELLAALVPLDRAGEPLPKYRYPSAGSLYPVQTYVYVRPGRVDGVEGGTYYHDPAAHRLVLLSPRPRFPRDVHDPRNQALFAESAFSLFLVGRMAAIGPVYGDLARDFCLLEAGYIGQLLMMSAPAAAIGLCPVGGLEFARVRRHFALDDDDELLHSFCGGPIDPAWAADGVTAASSRANGMSVDLSALSHNSAPRASCRAKSEDRPRLDALSLLSLNFDSSSAHDTSASPDEVDPSGQLEAELRAHLAAVLPPHLVPSAIVVTGALPLTANGKVDRAALRAAGVPARRALTDETAPAGPMQDAVARAWARVLGVAHVGAHDRLAALGADSVHVVQVAALLRAELGREVPVAEMFRCGTVAELAARLGGPSAGAHEANARGSLRRERAGRRRGSA